MKSILSAVTIGLGSACILASSAAAAASAPYPAKPVRIITTSLPGSATDVPARLLAARLTERWGQQFIVDNRGGAGGQIAAEIAAGATPDGYTLFNSSDGAIAIIPATRRNIAYNPLRDFEPVAFSVYNNYVLVVHPSLPVRSVSDLVQLAKTRAGALRFGSAGIGSPNHMGMELFKLKAGIDMIHVPYKGGPAATADLLAGQIELAMLGPPSIPHVKSGRLRAIAVPSAERSELTPDLAPIAETVPGVDVRTWSAIFAPSGIPKPILEKLHVEITLVFNLPDTKRLLAQQGLTPSPMTREELRNLVRADLKKHSAVAKAMKIP